MLAFHGRTLGQSAKWHNDINSDISANMALAAYGLQAEPRFGGAGFNVLKDLPFRGRMAMQVMPPPLTATNKKARRVVYASGF